MILTANDMETDEVMGLTLGADDYMTKPFSLAVLRARIQLFRKRIAARRAGTGTGSPDALFQNNSRYQRNGAAAAAEGGNLTSRTVLPKMGVFEEEPFRFDFDRLEYTGMAGSFL